MTTNCPGDVTYRELKFTVRIEEDGSVNLSPLVPSDLSPQARKLIASELNRLAYELVMP